MPCGPIVEKYGGLHAPGFSQAGAITARAAQLSRWPDGPEPRAWDPSRFTGI